MGVKLSSHYPVESMYMYLVAGDYGSIDCVSRAIAMAQVSVIIGQPSSKFNNDKRCGN